MSTLIKISIFFLIFNAIICPPVKKAPEKEEVNQFVSNVKLEHKFTFDINALNNSDDLHYKTYLEEVIKELEGDKKFAEEIKNAQEHNRTEHIAHSLTFVNHHIRNKLDEIKRKEIERLNLLEKELERRKLSAKGIKVPSPDSNLERILTADKSHIDHSNPHSFEISDLQKLIQKTEEDLKWVDAKQEEIYKEHEMKKEYLKKKKMESVKDPKEREIVSKQIEESEKRHDNHSKIHHPGNREQLKEVWEKDDKLDPKQFNPKAFFDIHDVNSDGKLDINEVEALMQNELSKVYEANNTDDDMQERYHEMMRMRHEMIKLMDTNEDNLISKEEFLQYSASANFKDDTDWKTQEETDKKPYTDQELNEFTDGYPAQADDDDDEFSDVDESLRHRPEAAGAQPPPPANIEGHKVDDNPSVVKADLPHNNNPPPAAAIKQPESQPIPKVDSASVKKDNVPPAAPV